MKMLPSGQVEQPRVDSEQTPRPRAPLNGCVIAAVAIVACIAIVTGIVVIGGGDRVIRALQVLRGEPQKVTIQVSPGELLPVLKLTVEEMHATVHTKRTGPVLGGVTQSLPRHIIAQGTITACFDLENNAQQFQTQIDPQDPEHVTVRLPQPAYCHVGIDNAQFFDEAGIGVSATNDVNGLLLQDAQQQLYVAADSQKLLDKAKERGASQIKEILYKLGFKRVDVIFAEPLQ